LRIFVGVHVVELDQSTSLINLSSGFSNEPHLLGVLLVGKIKGDP
jgi:hypothetical protein